MSCHDMAPPPAHGAACDVQRRSDACATVEARWCWSSRACVGASHVPTARQQGRSPGTGRDRPGGNAGGPATACMDIMECHHGVLVQRTCCMHGQSQWLRSPRPQCAERRPLVLHMVQSCTHFVCPGGGGGAYVHTQAAQVPRHDAPHPVMELHAIPARGSVNIQHAASKRTLLLTSHTPHGGRRQPLQHRRRRWCSNRCVPTSSRLQRSRGADADCHPAAKHGAYWQWARVQFTLIDGRLAGQRPAAGVCLSVCWLAL